MSEIKTVVPAGYADFLADIKQRIQNAQLRASLAVNHELVLLYWGIGKDILVRQEKDGWGTRVIERLAKGLRIPDEGAARLHGPGHRGALLDGGVYCGLQAGREHLWGPRHDNIGAMSIGAEP